MNYSRTSGLGKDEHESFPFAISQSLPNRLFISTLTPRRAPREAESLPRFKSGRDRGKDLHDGTAEVLKEPKLVLVSVMLYRKDGDDVGVPPYR